MSNSKSSKLIQFRLSNKVYEWLHTQAARSGMTASVYTKTIVERLFTKQTGLVIKRDGNGTIRQTALPCSPRLWSLLLAYCRDAADPYERAGEMPAQILHAMTLHGNVPRDEEIELRAQAIGMILSSLDPGIDPSEVLDRVEAAVQPPFFRQRDREFLKQANKE